jgi:hypothetical protein
VAAVSRQFYLDNPGPNLVQFYILFRMDKSKELCA